MIHRKKHLVASIRKDVIVIMEGIYKRREVSPEKKELLTNPPT